MRMGTRGGLKEAAVEQQVKVPKLERQGFNRLTNFPTPTETAGTREVDSSEDQNPANIHARFIEVKKHAETVAREAKE
jgi:hypothetical protein